jgi:hypothetical protein
MLIPITFQGLLFLYIVNSLSSLWRADAFTIGHRPSTSAIITGTPHLQHPIFKATHSSATQLQSLSVGASPDADLLLRTLRGEAVYRPPVWMLRQVVTTSTWMNKIDPEV